MPASAVRRARRAAAAVQRGQALPLALGLLLAGAAMMAVMVSAGQVVATKQRLTDTADAAAWSAATWRARVLNYHAYSNRAIVANEVAIAQAVALRAWTQYFETLTRNAAAVGSYLPVVGPALAGVAEAAALARESARIAAELEIPARGAEGVGYKEILQASQEILHLSSQAFAASMVAAEVARATDPDFFAWVLPDPDRGWQRLTHRADSIEARRRTADLVRASLDPFTAGPRNDDITVPVPSPCLSFMRLKKRGITTLSEDLDRWESVDTLSFHVRTLSRLRCREREAVPLGWGATEAGDVSHRIENDRDGIGLNPQAGALAEAAMTSQGTYGGIARVRELDYEALADARFPTGPLAVVARERARSVRTIASRGVVGDRLSSPEDFAGDGEPAVHALAAAEVYFRRPVDAPARLEYASLFNPYWQVRLIAPTPAQRAVAQGYVR